MNACQYLTVSIRNISHRVKTRFWNTAWAGINTKQYSKIEFHSKIEFPFYEVKYELKNSSCNSQIKVSDRSWPVSSHMEKSQN